jgi:hypothetical protein
MFLVLFEPQMSKFTMVRAKFAQVPLDVYAEFAAYLAPETMNLFLRKRLEFSAAVLIQFHFRRFLSRRADAQVRRLLIFRIIRRWKRRTERLREISAISRCCKCFIAKSLLLFIRMESATRSGDSLIQPAFQFVNDPNLSASWTSKQKQSDFPEIKTDFTKVEALCSPSKGKPSNRRRVFEASGAESDPCEERKQSPSSLPNSSLAGSGTTQHSAIRTQRVIGNSKFFEAQQKILVYLVSRIQALFRGRKARRLSSKLRADRELKRQVEANIEALRKSVFEAAAMRENRKMERFSKRKALSMVPHESKPELVEVVPAMVVDVERSTDQHSQDERDSLIKGSAFPPLTPGFAGQSLAHDNRELACDGSNAMNVVKARMLCFVSQATLIWLEANLLIVRAAKTIDPRAFEDRLGSVGGRTIHLEGVNIIIPQDVDGVLSHGLVIDQDSPLHGCRLDDREWAVAEITDTEEYELHPEVARNAASRIQRVFRRFLTRRKYLSYLQEREPDARLPPHEISSVQEDGAQGGSEAVNTDSCIIS